MKEDVRSITQQVVAGLVVAALLAGIALLRRWALITAPVPLWAVLALVLVISVPLLLWTVRLRRRLAAAEQELEQARAEAERARAELEHVRAEAERLRVDAAKEVRPASATRDFGQGLRRSNWVRRPLDGL